MSGSEVASDARPAPSSKVWLLVGLLLAALAVGIGLRFLKHRELHSKAAPSDALPGVRVAKPQQAPTEVTLTVPGSVRPRERVVLYARTNGFLSKWLVDMGDRVKEGQVLARIDTPEVSANMAQAKARLTQAKSSIGLVRSQHERVVNLSKNGTLSQQDVDASALRLTAAESELATATAEVERLSALVSFATVVAPFEGTITKRYLDNGALVNTGQTALFDLASTSDLRVDVDVPQWLAPQVVPGAKAKVTVGKDDKAYEAVVTRTAGALDPVLRTLTVQLQFTAAVGEVVPGSYARVTMAAPRGEPALQVPNAALVLRNGPPMVAKVLPDGRLHFTPVKVVRDVGRDVEVQGELATTDQVALYPSPQLQEGDRVRPVEAAK